MTYTYSNKRKLSDLDKVNFSRMMDIVRLKEEGKSGLQLAKIFNLSHQRIYKILSQAKKWI